MKRQLAPICIVVLGLSSVAWATTMYFEAEMGINIRPNLEIIPREGASGGLALGVFEGGGGNHTWLGGLDCSIDIGTAEYPFEIEADGQYVVWGRAWWSDKCGNSILVAVDGKQQYDVGDHSSEDPVFETWHWMPSCVFELSKGPHTLNVMAKEDGIFIDQWAIAPAGTTPSGVGKLTHVPALSPDPPSALDLSVSRESEVIDSKGRLRFTVWLRKCQEGSVAGRLVVSADEGPKISCGNEVEFEMKADETLRPLPVTVTYPSSSRRNEKRVIFTVVHGDVALARRAVVVVKPFQWHLLGPLPEGSSLEGQLAYGLEVDPAKPVRYLVGETAKESAWQQPPVEKVLNRYQTFDFEKLYGQSLGRCVYLYTTIVSPRDQTVLMLVNNDDHAHVWINGELVFEELESHPAEGYLGRKKISLKKGQSRIFVKVTQSDYPDRTNGMESPNYWLFRLRLRKSSHKPAELWGK